MKNTHTHFRSKTTATKKTTQIVAVSTFGNYRRKKTVRPPSEGQKTHKHTEETTLVAETIRHAKLKVFLKKPTSFKIL